MPVHLTAYRERRVLKRLHASSLSVCSVLGSQILVSFVIAILGSILLTILSMIVFKSNAPKMWELLIPAFILGTLCFTSLGVLAGSDSAEHTLRTGNRAAVVFCADDTGGAGPPREAMSNVMNAVG